MIRTAIAFPRESRSYSPCATHAKRRARSVIRLHAQVIFTVVESVFPVSLPPQARARPGCAGPGWTGPHLAVRPGRAGPGRAGQLPAPGRASERDRRQGFGAHDRAGLRHATGGRASERDQASAHTTGPGFGTPLAQLIPRKRIGLSRFSPFVSKTSSCAYLCFTNNASWQTFEVEKTARGNEMSDKQFVYADRAVFSTSKVC